MRRAFSRREILLGMLASATASWASVCDHFDPSNPPGMEGFQCEPRTADGHTHSLYSKGSGPAVFVLHELPGLYRADIDLARRVAKCGFTAYVPLFFGKPDECHPVRNVILKPLDPVSEFSFWLPHTPAAARWLEPQLAYAHSKSGGKGVAIMGMCLTGSLPLAVISSPLVKAVVLCQPTNPFLFPSLVDLSKADRDKLTTVSTQVLGFHFSQDHLSPEARWNTLRKLLSDRLTEMIIDSRPGNPGGVSSGAHSTLAGDGIGSAQEQAFQFAIRYMDNRISETPTTKPWPSPDEQLPPGFVDPPGTHPSNRSPR